MLGVVMAGGESRRLGADKAHVRLHGEPMWQRQRRVLFEAGATRTVIIRRTDQLAPEDMECWRDEDLGIGPLAGLHAALAPRAATHVMILAVDMPGLTATWFRWLQEHCRPGCGAMVRHEETWEPLAAIYPAEALEEIQARILRREHALQRLATALAERGRLTLVPADATARAALRGLNTPEDLAFWQKSECRSPLAGDERCSHSATESRLQAGSYMGNALCS